ncbi:MAG: hypothetical protein ACHQQQ_01600 [Bacteroidota bacterium]
MGQQQLLLIILGVIIVGVAIAVGISMFSGQSIASNRDAIITDLSTLGADAYQFKIRPTSMGGGNGTFAGYTINTNGAWGTGNPNATYTVTTQTATQLVLTATSKQVNGASVTVTYDGNGKASAPVTTGF